MRIHVVTTSYCHVVLAIVTHSKLDLMSKKPIIPKAMLSLKYKNYGYFKFVIVYT